MMYWDGDGSGWGWMVAMMMIMILFWGSLVALIWVGIRSLVQRPGGSVDPARPESGAREILAQRLARGEIEPEEYTRRLALLGDRR
jgi:putative membrane protein